MGPKKHFSTNVKSSRGLRSHANINRTNCKFTLWTRNLGRVVKTETWQQKKKVKISGVIAGGVT
jgi:hypothetical protein